MKKIAFFMATPFSLGGEQRVVTIISNMLLKKGYDVTIICTDMTTPIDYSIYNLNHNVKIGYVRGFNNKIVTKIRDYRWKLYYENLKTGKYKNNLFIQKFINCDFITKVLLKHSFKEYDCIISLSTIYNTMLAGVSKKIKAKTIGWQHNMTDVYFRKENFRHYNQDLYTKYMLNKLDKYVVLTKKDADRLEVLFNVKAEVINNPKPFISSKKSDLKNKQFLAVGRFDEVKNHIMLIDMFNEFYKKNKNWKLVIVGAGELKSEYIKKIENYNLQKNIIIKDYTNKMEELYLHSAILLMPSLYEGWSMVLNEAIEFGLPIISFDLNCSHEIIENGKSGFIVESYNQKEYVKCMLELASNPEKLKKFSKRTIQIAKSKSNDHIADQWDNMIKSLI